MQLYLHTFQLFLQALWFGATQQAASSRPEPSTSMATPSFRELLQVHRQKVEANLPASVLSVVRSMD
jgi:hypothetical protein